MSDSPIPLDVLAIQAKQIEQTIEELRDAVSGHSKTPHLDIASSYLLGAWLLSTHVRAAIACEIDRRQADEASNRA